MTNKLTRREVIKSIAATAIVGTAAPSAVGQHGASIVPTSDRKRVLRLAHLTDIHVQPERKADQGLVACLHHVQKLADAPQLILTGGDSVFDSFESDDARTQLQWDLWNRIFANECSLPVQTCVGNHDIWGWYQSRSKTTGNEPNYGKKRAIENLRLSNSYYSVDHACGWRFIVLDSVQPNGEGYLAYLDDEQFDWLRRDLRDADPSKPVLVLSHIPILSAAGLLFSKQEKNGNYTVSCSRVHRDAAKLKELFSRHPTVKMCLSGHLHHVDRVDYNGVAYLCGGAVSGNWWKGRHRDCDEGYSVIDLYNDGTFEREYVTYGWKAVE